MEAVIKRNNDGSLRSIKIQRDNGDVFKIEADIEDMLQITKEYGDDTETICVNPRYGNQIAIK